MLILRFILVFRKRAKQRMRNLSEISSVHPTQPTPSQPINQSNRLTLNDHHRPVPQLLNCYSVILFVFPFQAPHYPLNFILIPVTPCKWRALTFTTIISHATIISLFK
ncbi:hypothetical protein L3Y34_015953 [Caenorhabditis briggsae]|uniref:Uncharacterized protein n=1 Tax=Caenorhabditis briggsae TaxID=6238 RepID=A0AAE9IZN5_CAEBR|nr:hypothetical protein L3Y34_015953 [Caenorhabditis briggsae]